MEWDSKGTDKSLSNFGGRIFTIRDSVEFNNRTVMADITPLVTDVVLVTVEVVVECVAVVVVAVELGCLGK